MKILQINVFNYRKGGSEVVFQYDGVTEDAWRRGCQFCIEMA